MTDIAISSSLAVDMDRLMAPLEGNWKERLQKLQEVFVEDSTAHLLRAWYVGRVIAEEEQRRHGKPHGAKMSIVREVAAFLHVSERVVFYRLSVYECWTDPARLVDLGKAGLSVSVARDLAALPSAEKREGIEQRLLEAKITAAEIPDEIATAQRELTAPPGPVAGAGAEGAQGGGDTPPPEDGTPKTIKFIRRYAKHVTDSGALRRDRFDSLLPDTLADVGKDDRESFESVQQEATNLASALANEINAYLISLNRLCDHLEIIRPSILDVTGASE